MTLDPKLSPKKQQTDHFSNELLSISIEINNSNEIYKDSKEINGIVILTPKFKMLNVPIQLSIIGESQCLLFDQNLQKNHQQQGTSKNTSTSFHVNQTQEDILQKRNQIQNCLHSTQYLSQNFQQKPEIKQKVHTQIFLQGKQILFQTFGQNQQKIQFLQPQKQYFYQLNFFLPSNLPSSINQQIFNGVHLFVNYKISVLIEMKEKYFIFQNQNIKKQVLAEVQNNVTIEKGFSIQRRNSVSNHQSLCNKMIFKYFNQEGKQVDNNFIEECCCLKYIYQKITKRPMKYDIYHCQILANINQFKTLNLTARIFIQPNKNHLDQRKIKKGKFYSTGQQQNQNENKTKQQNNKKDEELTISKVMDSGRQKQLKVKIRHILVAMYGEIIGVKKIKVFQKIISLDREMYDMSEGQMIREIPFEYFSDKNQLFQIKFWFQINPLSQQEAEILKQQEIQESFKTKNRNKTVNQFNITMSQLNEEKQREKQRQKLQRQIDRVRKQTKNIKSKLIQKINQEINPIQL